MAPPLKPLVRRWPSAGRWLPAVLGAVALAALLAAGERLGQAWQADRVNQQMASAAATPGAPAVVVLAHAIELDRRGQFEEALNAYAEAETVGGDSVRQAVRVNVANLYLRRGILVARQDGHAQRAIAMLQLAKASYRRALRARPDDWNARYNLELALRVLPDFEERNWRASGPEAEERLLKDKAAWTEMVGQPRGMH